MYSFLAMVKIVLRYYTNSNKVLTLEPVDIGIVVTVNTQIK